MTQNSQHHTSDLKIGIALAIISNVLFGVFYLFSGWLAPMTGTQVFVWRLVSMFFMVVMWLVVSRQLNTVLSDIRALAKPKSLLWLLAPTPILLSQLWLFMWAPLNGHGVAVAMGYFLFPLMMVLAGCLLFGERLIGLQKLAVLLAGVGVTLEIIQGGSLTWATFWVCITYPIYYLMRRQQGIRAITGLLVDTAIFFPFGIVYLWYDGHFSHQVLTSLAIFKVILLGFASVLAFLANLQSVRLLPVSLFGMLSYLEPLLLFVLAVTFLQEPLTAQMFVSYGLIWLGIVCLIIHGLHQQKKRQV